MAARDPRAEAQAASRSGPRPGVEPSPRGDRPAVVRRRSRAGRRPAGRGVVAPVRLGAARPGTSGSSTTLSARAGRAERRARRPPPADRAAGLGRPAWRSTGWLSTRCPCAPERERQIGLRFTTGGFGTPFFGDDEQVRIEGDRIVRQAGGRARDEPLTTLAAAAALALDGPPDLAWAEGSDVPPAGDPRATLGLDPVAARLLGDRHGFAWSALEERRADPARGRRAGTALARAL